MLRQILRLSPASVLLALSLITPPAAAAGSTSVSVSTSSSGSTVCVNDSCYSSGSQSNSSYSQTVSCNHGVCTICQGGTCHTYGTPAPNPTSYYRQPVGAPYMPPTPTPAKRVYAPPSYNSAVTSFNNSNVNNNSNPNQSQNNTQNINVAQGGNASVNYSPGVSTPAQPAADPPAPSSLPVSNSPQPGALYGLPQGIQPRSGPGLSYGFTIPAQYNHAVPQPNWMVEITGPSTCADGIQWWPFDRGAAGDPSGGTGYAPLGNCSSPSSSSAAPSSAGNQEPSAPSPSAPQPAGPSSDNSQSAPATSDPKCRAWLTGHDDPGVYPPVAEHHHWLEAPFQFDTSKQYVIVDMTTNVAYNLAVWDNLGQDGHTRFGIHTAYVLTHPGWKAEGWVLIYQC